MTEAREEILRRIRTALRGTPDPAGTVPRGYRQVGTSLPGAPELLDLLTDRLVDYRATVHRCGPDAVGDTIAAVLADILPPDGRVVVPRGLPIGWAPPGAVTDDGTLTHAELDGMAAVVTGCAAAAAAPSATLRRHRRGGRYRRSPSHRPAPRRSSAAPRRPATSSCRGSRACTDPEPSRWYSSSGDPR